MGRVQFSAVLAEPAEKDIARRPIAIGPVARRGRKHYRNARRTAASRSNTQVPSKSPFDSEREQFRSQDRASAGRGRPRNRRHHGAAAGDHLRERRVRRFADEPLNCADHFEIPVPGHAPSPFSAASFLQPHGASAFMSLSQILQSSRRSGILLLNASLASSSVHACRSLDTSMCSLLLLRTGEKFVSGTLLL